MNFGGIGRWASGVEFASPLGPAPWAVLAGVPVAIIALYFLKLRRRPVQVPSTLLWRRSLEDLHVNSLFQRLRRNLLLFLQLLAVLLTMLALAGLKVRGTEGAGQRFVLAIDHSASMSATDVAPSRLARAKEEAKKVVSAMDDDDLAMVIAFADRARVVSNYSGDRAQLLKRIDAIEPTEAPTSLREALQVAAGLANPAKQVGEGVKASEMLITPKLKVFTDGGFPDVEGFSLGNLEPEVVVIGPPVPASAPPREAGGPVPALASDNVAILALQTRRNEETPDEYQVFGRVHNYRDEPVTTEAKLFRHDRPGDAGTLIDAIALKVPARSDQAFKFDLPDTGEGVALEVRLDVADALALDNRAYTVIGRPRRAQVLVVTPGDRYLIDALATPLAAQAAEVTVAKPDEATADPLARDLLAGRFDLVIYDGVRPESPPQANALYFGALPPGKAYDDPRELDRPIILDWDVAHPLMQYIRDLSQVFVSKAAGVEPPPGATVLIESNLGPLAFVAPREGFADAVVTFGLLEGKTFNTTWPLRISFPLFLYNAVQVLGNAREAGAEDVHQPGRPVVLRADPNAATVTVTDPSGRSHAVERGPQGTFLDTAADRVGLYRASWGRDQASDFAVNLFDPRESDLAPRGLAPEGVPEAQKDAYRIKIGYNPVAGTRRAIPARKDWWKPISVVVLSIILFEWYVYNRRVYI